MMRKIIKFLFKILILMSSGLHKKMSFLYKLKLKMMGSLNYCKDIRKVI